VTTQHYDAFKKFLQDETLTPFYDKRYKKLTELTLKQVLSRKNPYLFKAKNIMNASDLVKGIVDAHLSSQEETDFGKLLEHFAIFVAKTLYGGGKSERLGLDLEFRRNNIHYIVEIKSGRYWGNDRQIRGLKNDFKSAKLKLRQELGESIQIVAVNGCMYGKDSKPYKVDGGVKSKGIEPDQEKDYYRYCGQDFWEFISEDPYLYKEIIKPIDEKAKEKGEEFREAYNAKVNQLTFEFSGLFLKDNQIDWEKLIDYVSKRAGTHAIIK
jgi:hypothetical protein